MRRMRACLLVLLAAAIIAVPVSAFADAELSFQVNGGTIQTQACPATGGCLGIFFAPGITFSVDVGTNLQPQITLTSNQTTSATPLTINVDYSVNNLTNPGPGFAQSFSGTIENKDSAQYTQYYSAGNGLDVLTTPVFTSGPITATVSPFQSFSFNNQGVFAFGSGPYSLTMLYTLNIPVGSVLTQSTQLTGAFLVPEPATLSLVGFGLLGLGIAVRKKWLKQ